jgi:hypothetical protein
MGAAGFEPATQYGRVWPNEWPNGQLHHGIQRRCVAPVTIETATGEPGGWAFPCRRAQRRCSTAATDGVSLRVLDASCPRRIIAGSPSATDHMGDEPQRGASSPVLRPRALRPRTSARARSTGLRARPGARRRRPLASAKHQSRPARPLVVLADRLAQVVRDARLFARSGLAGDALSGAPLCLTRLRGWCTVVRPP